MTASVDGLRDGKPEGSRAPRETFGDLWGGPFRALKKIDQHMHVETEAREKHMHTHTVAWKDWREQSHKSTQKLEVMSIPSDKQKNLIQRGIESGILEGLYSLLQSN